MEVKHSNDQKLPHEGRFIGVDGCKRFAYADDRTGFN